MALKMELSSRQQEIIRALLQNHVPLSPHDLANDIGVSVRTVQRDLKELQSVFVKYGLAVQKNRRKGVWLEGSEKSRKQLKHDLYFQQKKRLFSQEERRLGLTFDLLLGNEPVKSYLFSRRYDVTEATISNDLNVLEEWFPHFDLELIRKPGLGVYIEKQEDAVRTAAVFMMTEQLSVDEWLGFFNRGHFSVETYFTKEILKKRLRIQELPHLERTVRQMFTTRRITFDDRDYVHFILHVHISLLRVQNGCSIESIKEETHIYSDNDMELAEEIAKIVQGYFYTNLPEQEIIYLAFKVLILKRINDAEDAPEPSNSQIPIDTMMAFIEEAGKNLGVSLSGDSVLMSGLISHLQSAVTRINNDMQIHNPLLGKISQQYFEVFQACEQAVPILERSLRISIPKAEIGYITLHIGSAAIRSTDNQTTKCRAVVVCASGIGTGRFLSTRIKKELPDVQVVDVVSMMNLADWLDGGNHVDVIISTVHLPFLEQDQNIVTVSPLLQNKDIEQIGTAVENLRSKHRGDLPSVPKKQPDTSHLLAVARYGEAISQILRNLFLYESVVFNGLRHLLDHFKTHDVIKDFERFVKDIKERERLGGFTWGALAMLHSRTESVSQVLMAVFRLQEPVKWPVSEGEYSEVQTLLVLAAPAGAPKEHVEIIGEISSALIEEDFMNDLKAGSEEGLQKAVEQVLTVSYKNKANLFNEGTQS
ncbi:MAG TPA: PRD domain-containing protein [Bacillales bacterium]|nr:PRD domain-containing protein [Bacillales bacterium]